MPKDLLRRIPVLNRQRRYRIDREAVAFFCSRLLQSLREEKRTLSVVFVGSGRMRSMNRRYRGKDYATDVLSFSYPETEIDGASFLGELVLAPEVAVRQALRYGVAPEVELRKLLVHGTLHLLGFDHEMDRGEMNRIQARLLRRKFFLDSPPLAEVSG